MSLLDLIVIGGGAAGLAAAIAAAECGDTVLVLERMDRVGKKLLATGNGRCNLMNSGTPRFPGGSAFAGEVLKRMDAKRQADFWRSHGLRLREEDGGRVYPACGQASAVLDTLRLAAGNANVQILTATAVTELRKGKGCWTVKAGEKVFQAGRIAVCGGGLAQDKLGSDGSCLKLLREMDIPVSKTIPALTQIETDTSLIRGLSGIRTKGRIRILSGKRIIHEEQGEILFADYGISGVCSMQCARYAEKGMIAELDLCPGLGVRDTEELAEELNRRAAQWGKLELSAIFTGLCVSRLGMAILSAAGVQAKNRCVSSLRANEIAKIADAAAHFRLEIHGRKGYATAQVTAGGADCDCFFPETMECRTYPGLYAAGEVLDVDGDCGGFNLMFAFGSGLLAGLRGRTAPWEKHVFSD